MTIEFETENYGTVTVTPRPDWGVHPNGHGYWSFKADAPFPWSYACSFGELSEAVEECCGPLVGEGVIK